MLKIGLILIARWQEFFTFVVEAIRQFTFTIMMVAWLRTGERVTRNNHVEADKLNREHNKCKECNGSFGTAW